MRFRYEWKGQVYEIKLDQAGAGYTATVGGRVYRLDILEGLPGQVSLLLGDRSVTLYYATEGDHRWVSMNGCTYLLKRPTPHGVRRAGEGDTSGQLRAPMPAQVRSIETLDGDQVERGQTLLLLEAMKMEIRVKAPRAGLVKKILVERGQMVDRDQILIELDD
jgi:acetyl/propionyl-CoA carboxylase alpha subunit